MRVKKKINLRIISGSNTKFFEHYKNCMVDSTENHKFDLRVKALIRWRRRRNEVSWCVITMNMLN